MINAENYCKINYIITLSRPFSMSFCSALLMPSSISSTSLTVSPERVLNFFLKVKKHYIQLNKYRRLNNILIPKGISLSLKESYYPITNLLIR